MAIGTLAAHDPKSRIVDDVMVDDVVVREDALSGRATIYLRHGGRIVITWPARRSTDAIARESSSRIAHALATVSAACTRATSSAG